MLVYRVVKKRWARDLSGIGSAMAGGRWNKKGSRIIYTSSTPELALLEYAVNLDPMKIGPSVRIVEIEIKSNSIKKLANKDLPKEWDQFPFHTILPEIGTSWLRALNSLILSVPSAVIPLSWNHLINPMHKDFDKVKILKIHDIKFDPRLKK